MLDYSQHLRHNRTFSCRAESKNYRRFRGNGILSRSIYDYDLFNHDTVRMHNQLHAIVVGTPEQKTREVSGSPAPSASSPSSSPSEASASASSVSNFRPADVLAEEQSLLLLSLCRQFKLM